MTIINSVFKRFTKRDHSPGNTPTNEQLVAPLPTLRKGILRKHW